MVAYYCQTITAQCHSSYIHSAFKVTFNRLSLRVSISSIFMSLTSLIAKILKIIENKEGLSINYQNQREIYGFDEFFFFVSTFAVALRGNAA